MNIRITLLLPVLIFATLHSSAQSRQNRNIVSDTSVEAMAKRMHALIDSAHETFDYFGKTGTPPTSATQKDAPATAAQAAPALDGHAIVTGMFKNDEFLSCRTEW